VEPLSFLSPLFILLNVIIAVFITIFGLELA
jgi:hypothetical protein